MTWSIVARDETTGAFGIAIASKAFAVGALCPHLRAGVGAIATQSLTNPYLGIWGLGLIESGMSATEAIEALIEADVGSPVRQIHAIDAQGRNTAFSGEDCIDWAGHRIADGVSVAGNMLAAPAVVDATLSTYLAHRERPLPERLLRAMDAGDQAGGDKRGRQSAAVRVVSREDYADLDIRVDDNADPIRELWRLYDVAHERFLPRRPFMATREDPAGLCSFAALDEAVEERKRTEPAPDFSAFWQRPVREGSEGEGS